LLASANIKQATPARPRTSATVESKRPGKVGRRLYLATRTNDHVR
jgi:hypothetical protein